MSDKYPGGLVTAAAPAGYSVFFDGSGDYLNSSITAIGTSNFTVEYWSYLTAHGGTNGEGGYFQISGTAGGLSGTYTVGVVAYRSSPGSGRVLAVIVGGTTISTTYVPGLDTWFHTAIVRNSNSVSVYVNGTLVSTPTTISTNLTGAFLAIGGYASTSFLCNGYISNFRVTNSALYTAAFTPPTQLFNVTNTSLLTCNSPAIIDQSNNAFAITANGNSAVSTFTPFPSSYYFYNAPTDGNTRNMLPSNIAGFNPAYGAAAPGVWTLDQAQYFAANRLWPIYDPYFNLTTLMLSGNQPSGVTDINNNVFKDSSTNNFPITRNGNTTQGTFSPFSQTGWGNFFNGSSSLYLATATALGTGNVTVEFWFYPTDTSTTYYGLYDGRGSNNSDTGLGIFQYGRTIEIYGNGLKVSTAANAFSANTWVHFAVVRTSGTCQIYINGIASGSSGSYSNNFTSTVRDIGRGVSAGFYFPGYISNLREVTSSLYSSNFTPSTTPLTAVAGTTLLTCQSNRFVDNSTNNYAITVTAGAPSVQPFSPFAPTAAYSAATVGGSGYFDGTGDFLSIANNTALNVGSGDFCIEAWFNASTLASQQIIVSNAGASGSDNTQIDVVSSQVRFTSAATTYLTSSGTVVVNAWNHVAACRSGTTLSLFVNGSRQATATNSTNFANANNYAFNTGGAPGYGGQFTGYISNIRVVKGSSVYDPTQTSITIPTAPLTAITNTSLLCNYTNAAIVDATSDNVLETVGNAQISTTQSRFGGSSMLFNGTSDYLVVPPTPNLLIGTGDFTLEAWVNATNFSTARALFSFANNNVFYFNTSGIPTYGIFGVSDTAFGSTALSTSTWVHVAFVRSGSTITCFLNGTSTGTVSSSASIGSATVVNYVGFHRSGNYWNGYIDDLRITRFARYTANFVPPTSALQLQ